MHTVDQPHCVVRKMVAFLFIYHVLLLLSGVQIQVLAETIKQQTERVQKHETKQTCDISKSSECNKTNLMTLIDLHTANNNQMTTSNIKSNINTKNKKSINENAVGNPVMTQAELSMKLYTKSQMERSETFLNRIEEFEDNKTSLTSLFFNGIVTKILSCVYSETYMHQYDDFEDLRVSGGSKVDQELCIRQLTELNVRVEQNLQKSGESIFESHDHNLHLLLDSFGRPGSGVFDGYTFWEGNFDKCLQTPIKQQTTMKKSLISGPSGDVDANNVDSGDKPTGETRYCIAHLRHPKWTFSKDISTLITLRTAACLPKACDSQNYKNKYQLVKNLIETQVGDMSQGQLELSSLYCLPDEESPLRTWWRKPATLIGVLLLSSWIGFLVYCTGKDCELARYPERAWRHPHRKLYKSLSISRNLCILLNCNRYATKQPISTDSIKTSKTTSDKEPPLKPFAEVPEEKIPIIDFSSLESVKVLALTYIITGHIIMILPSTIMNPINVGRLKAPLIVLSNLMPAFAVNAFFTITGLLTSYTVLKAGRANYLFTTPSAWVKLLLLRYVRIMPLYALVIYYTKHIAKYTSDGPYWDYATSMLSQRRVCEHESWSWALLFAANFKSPLEHCVPSAWYLANDFQFMIVTPIFIFLLDRYKWLGKRIVYMCIALASFSAFFTIFSSPLVDFKPIAMFMPHAFKTYVSFLTANYTRPYNRIQTYLIGLIFGQMLCEYEKRKRKYLSSKAQIQVEQSRELEQKRASIVSMVETALNTNDNSISAIETSKLLEKAEEEIKRKYSVDKMDIEEPQLDDWIIKWAPSIGAFSLIIGTLIPSIAHRIPFTALGPLFTKFMVAFTMSLYHVVFSTGVGLYLMLVITGRGNRMVNTFLTNPFWKPLSKLSLVVMLINIEVICYLFQSARRSVYIDSVSHLQMCFTAIAISYIVGAVLYLLFEAPLKMVFSQLVSASLSKFKEKKKSA